MNTLTNIPTTGSGEQITTPNQAVRGRGWFPFPTPSVLALGVLLSFGLLPASSQVFFSEDFEVDPTAEWTVNTVGDGSDADFFFDYSTVGIPSAPNSAEGTTRGLRLRANQFGSDAGFPDGLSVSPTGQGFEGDFELRFDLWINFIGPAPGGGSGSTQVTGAGIGTAGASAQVAGTADSIHVGTTGDGGSIADYRVYAPVAPASFQDGDPVYAAASRNNTDPYYEVFGEESAPAAQVDLFPSQTGTTAVGAQGWAWRDVQIKKFGDTVTWQIDGLLIATVDLTTAGTLGGSNILFNQYDINAGPSADPDSTNLLFGLIDNVTVIPIFTVSVNATQPDASEEGPTPGTFTINRTGPTTNEITVNYVMSGTASNGVDYVELPGSVTLGVGADSTDITLTPIDDSETEFTETAILTILPDPSYTIGAAIATVNIADNEPTEVSIAVLHSNMYERIDTDFTTYTITRKGDVSGFTGVNLDYSGTADNFTDYNGNTFASFNAGETSVIITNTPIDDTEVEGLETVIATIAPNASYNVGSPASATTHIIDDDLGPETVLFSDDFDTDTSANWTRTAAATANDTDDSVTFNYDYSIFGIPAAPGGFTTTGLRVTANKQDTTNSAAGVNLYPTGLSVSNNYALRFQMFIEGVDGASTTEHVLFGINHSGTRTNWAIRSTGGTGFSASTPGDGDGIWFNIGEDANGFPGGGDYGAFDSTLSPPTVLASTTAGSFAQTFKTPTYRFTGVPTSFTPNLRQAWVDVEVLQMNNVITLSINKTEILKFANTTGYETGAIMLGYNDAFSSIGGGTANTVEQSGDFFSGYVVFDNVRVVDLTLLITEIQVVDGNVQIDFIGTSADTPASFELRSAVTVDGVYAVDNAAAFTQLSPGTFRVTTPVNGDMQYYQVVKP